MDAEGDRGRQARPRREALLAPVGRGRGGVGRRRSRRRRRDGGLHVAPPPAGGGRAIARRGRLDRPAPRHPHDVQLPAARPEQHPDDRRPRRRRADGRRLLLHQRRAAARRRARARVRRAGDRPDGRRRRLLRNAPLSRRRRRAVRRVVHAAGPPAPGGRRRGRDARARGAMACGPGRASVSQRQGGRHSGVQLVHARARELRGRDRRARRSSCSGGTMRSPRRG